jgi:hypothetical protein
MASTLISNIYEGDGTTVLYSFTFPYIEIADVKVKLDDVATTEYIFANATTIQFNTAPAQGTSIYIYRDTDDTDLKAVFFPGSAIRARDLNDDFTQTLYVVQEATINVGGAVDAATEAIETANAAASQASTAIATADAAQTVAQGADAKATASLEGVSTAQDAATQSSADAAQASADAAAAQTAATAAEEYAQEVADNIAEAGVLSINGQAGVVELGLGDLTDVDTSSSGHVPTDGQALVWNQSMSHWMPASVSLNIAALPTLP